MASDKAVQTEKVHKPTLNIRASVDSYSNPDTEYDKRRRKELKSEIAIIKKHLSNWDGEKVASSAKADLEHQLISKQNQLQEYSGRRKLSMA